MHPLDVRLERPWQAVDDDRASLHRAGPLPVRRQLLVPLLVGVDDVLLEVVRGRVALAAEVADHALAGNLNGKEVFMILSVLLNRKTFK